MFVLGFVPVFLNVDSRVSAEIFDVDSEVSDLLFGRVSQGWI